LILFEIYKKIGSKCLYRNLATLPVYRRRFGFIALSAERLVSYVTNNKDLLYLLQSNSFRDSICRLHLDRRNFNTTTKIALAERSSWRRCAEYYYFSHNQTSWPKKKIFFSIAEVLKKDGVKKENYITAYLKREFKKIQEILYKYGKTFFVKTFLILPLPFRRRGKSLGKKSHLSFYFIFWGQKVVYTPCLLDYISSILPPTLNSRWLFCPKELTLVTSLIFQNINVMGPAAFCSSDNIFLIASLWRPLSFLRLKFEFPFSSSVARITSIA